jgi:hypothetical protein
MKRKLIWVMLIVFILLLLNLVSAVDYYETKIVYDKGDVSIKSVVKVATDVANDNLPGGYVAEIVDEGGVVLDVVFFDIPRTLIYDELGADGNLSRGGRIELEQKEVTLMLPYYSNALKVNVYGKNIKLMDSQMISQQEIILEDDESNPILYLVAVLILAAITLVVYLFRNKLVKNDETT